jgi:hypothetical protein
MAKFTKFNKNDNNFKKDDKKTNFQKKKKPTYVKKQFKIAYTDFYAETLDSLYNILNEISWDKISIPVKMSRAELLGDKSAKGTIVIGAVTKFNTDNTFTVSMTEDNAKAITDKHVISVRCYKDFNTGEITFITELTLTNKFDSIDDHFKDIEEAFTDADEDELVEVDEDTDVESDAE